MNKYFLAILLLILTVGCSSTNTLTLNTLNPPIIHTPKNSTKIGIINRTTNKNKSDKIFNKLEQILSAETFSIDEEAVSEIIEGFGSQVTNNSKFENSKLIEYKDPSKITLDEFPKLLDWNYIEKLCNDNDVDFIVELSFLDTDSDVNYSSRDKEVNVPIIGTKIMKEHIAEVQTRITCGWRIYIPDSRIIADEFKFTSDFGLRGEGINPLTALREVLKSRDLILRECRILGEDYAFRLQPYRLRVTRQYFVRGSENFKTAKRYAQAGDWDKAAEFWRKEIRNPDLEIRGRAFYNMAIISEIRADLPAAIKWATRAYAECEIDLALKYIEILRNRANSKEYMDQNY